MSRLIAISLLTAVTPLSFGCSGDDGASTTTPSPTPTSLIRNVPSDQIDGSTSSEKFEAAPSGASPAVNLEAATSLVRAQAMGAGILEVVLLKSIDQLNDPPNPPKLVWVGSLEPETFPALVSAPMCIDATCPPRGEAHTQFAYVVIDAMTGEFLHTASSSYFESVTPTPVP